MNTNVMPISEKFQKKKKQIIDAAIQLFATQGYYKTTTADVARVVGVTQPYIFHFFQTKEELFLAVLDRAVNLINRTFANVKAPPEQLADAMGRSFNDLLTSDRDEVLLSMQAFTTPEVAIRDHVRGHFQMIYQTVSERFEQAGVVNHSYQASMFLATGLIISLSEVLDIPELLPWHFIKDNHNNT